MSNPTCIKKCMNGAHIFLQGLPYTHCLFSPSGTSSVATNISQNVALIFHEEWNNSPSKLTIPPSTMVYDT